MAAGFSLDFERPIVELEQKIQELKEMDPKELLSARAEKYRRLGLFVES